MGMRASVHDVVLLNMIRRSRRAGCKSDCASLLNPRIATVTPFSNASGAFSVPEIGINAPIPFPFTPQMLRLTERLRGGYILRCPPERLLYVYQAPGGRRDRRNRYREFWARLWGGKRLLHARGKAGWCNVIDDSLFIYHRGNNSFGEEKQTLVAQNRLVLDRLHPDYTGLVREFTNSAQINALRARIGEGLRQGEPELHLEKRRVLYVLHEGSGGVPMTNADLVSRSTIRSNASCSLQPALR